MPDETTDTREQAQPIDPRDIRSGATYSFDLTKRCMVKGCRAPSTCAVVAYSFDTRDWIAACSCEAHREFVQGDAGRASATSARERVSS